MTDSNQNTTADGPDRLLDLEQLRAGFPAFRIWREIMPGRTRYIARRLDPGPGLHTVVTDDLTELRETLNGENARPATGTGQNDAKTTATLVQRNH